MILLMTQRIEQINRFSREGFAYQSDYNNSQGLNQKEIRQLIIWTKLMRGEVKETP